MDTGRRLSRTILGVLALGAFVMLLGFDMGCRRHRVRRYQAAQATQQPAQRGPAPKPAPGPRRYEEPVPETPPPAQPGEGEIRVEARGDGENLQEATNNALRQAVEKGVGVEITSRTETLDYAVAFDRIITRAQGYVKSYKITRKKETRFDARVWIEAIVSKKKIQDDWAQIQMILERVGRPTVMVLFKETVVGPNGVPIKSPTSIAATAVEKLLLEKGFNLKAARALRAIERRKKEAALATDDLAALKAIATNYGANIMIVGKATARFNGKQKIYQGTVDDYVATASIMVYKSDTGEILVRDTFTGHGAALGQAAALQNAYEKLSNRLSRETLKKLLNKWYFEFQHGQEIQVELIITSAEGGVGLQAAKFGARFGSRLKGIRGVNNVHPGRLVTTADRAVQVFRVPAKMSAHALARKIMGLDLQGAGYAVTITDTQKHSLQVTMHVGEEGGAGTPGPSPEGDGNEPPSAGLEAQGGEVVVRVKGEGENKDQAVNDALRRAVQKGAGVEITSRTETLDYAVAFERIVSRSRGYVKTYKILSTKSEEFHVSLEVEAVVSTAAIKNDWGQIQMVLERLGRPTIMVLVKEKVFGEDGKPQDAASEFCTSSIENLLLEKGFDLKSAKGLKDIERRKRDAALATGDLASLKAIALDYGANVMIVGDASARFNGKKKSYGGVTVHSFMANASIKVYKTDTADLLVSLSFDNKADAMGPAEAITKAFKGIGKSLSGKVLRKLLHKWYFEFQHGFSIEMEIVVKASGRKAHVAVARFIEMLRGEKGVDRIIERNMQTHEDTTRQKVQVMSKLQAAALKNKILFMDTQGMGFEPNVTAADQNTLEVTLVLK
jgi:3-hydroxymyristoyl/3-hydroxydecanoyl-(acyl carrier protein) dehydratase